VQSQIKFNTVPEKVPEKVWEALVQSHARSRGSGEGLERFEVPGGFGADQVRLNRVPKKVPEKVWEALVQSQVQYCRLPEKVAEKVWEAVVRSQVRRRFRRRYGRLWCRARSSSTEFRRRFRSWAALVESEVRFNRVPKKVPEKLLGGFGAEPGQVQQGSGEGSREGLGGFGAEPGQVQQGSGAGGFGAQVRFNRVPEKVPEKVWEALVQSRVRFNGICGNLAHGNQPEVFPALGLATRFSKKTLRLMGIPPKLILIIRVFIGILRAP